METQCRACSRSYANSRNRRDHEIQRHRFNFVGRETFAPTPFVIPLPITASQSPTTQMSIGSTGSPASLMDISPAPTVCDTPDTTPRSRSLSTSANPLRRSSRRSSSVLPQLTAGASYSMPPPCSRSCILHCGPCIDHSPANTSGSLSLPNPTPTSSSGDSPASQPTASPAATTPSQMANRPMPPPTHSPQCPTPTPGPAPPQPPGSPWTPGPRERKCRYCLYEFASPYLLNRHIREDRCPYIFNPTLHNLSDYTVLRRPLNYQITRQILEQLNFIDQVRMCRQNDWAVPGIWPLVFPGMRRCPPILTEMTAARESTNILRALLRQDRTVNLPRQIIVRDDAHDIQSVLKTRLLTPGTAFVSQERGNQIIVSLRKFNTIISYFRIIIIFLQLFRCLHLMMDKIRTRIRTIVLIMMRKLSLTS